MKTSLKILSILIILVSILYINKKPIAYDGGFDGGRTYAKCYGIERRIKTNDSDFDAISGITYCYGIIKKL